MLYIMVGSVMMVYLKRLGASATILSIANSFIYFLDILQIIGARYVEKIGYRKFVVTALSVRAVFVFATACVMLVTMENMTRIHILLVVLFCFNTVRSISLCGVLPWMTHIVPANLRGKFVSRDQMCIGIGMVMMSLVVSFYFQYFTHMKDFAPIYFTAFLLTILSLFFLRRTPDAILEKKHEKHSPTPWRKIFGHAPFRNLLIYNFVLFFSAAGGMVFWVPFFKDLCHASDFQTLMTGVLYGIAAIPSLFYFGKIIDRVGSRPMLAMANVILIIHFAGWLLVAAKILPFNWPMLFWQQFTAGVCFPLFNTANTRMAMMLTPSDERSHFLAMFNVVKSLTLGGAPILWGLLIDRMMTWQGTYIGAWHWNAYSVFYTGLVFIVLIAFLFRMRLDDPGSMTTMSCVKEIFTRLPARAVSRIWQPDVSTP